MLGSNSRRLPDLEHGEKCESVKHSVDDNKCIGFLPLGESPGGLFIRVIRGAGNNV
jgi:hypothetical protein